MSTLKYSTQYCDFTSIQLYNYIQNNLEYHILYYIYYFSRIKPRINIVKRLELKVKRTRMLYTRR